MTVSRITDNYTRNLQIMERIAENKLERTSSDTETDDADKKVQEVEQERKIENYETDIKSHEREQEDENATEIKQERLSANNVTTPEDIRTGKAREAEQKKLEEAERTAPERGVGAVEETEGDDDADTLNAQENEDDTRIPQDGKEDQRQENQLSAQDAYQMLAGDRVGREFVNEINARGRVDADGDILRSERNLDRQRGQDTSYQDERLRDLRDNTSYRREDGGQQSVTGLQNFDISVS